MTPEEYQQFLIRQMQNAGMGGHVQQGDIANAHQPMRSWQEYHESYPGHVPDIDSMKRANARVVETPKLK